MAVSSCANGRAWQAAAAAATVANTAVFNAVLNGAVATQKNQQSQRDAIHEWFGVPLSHPQPLAGTSYTTLPRALVPPWNIHPFQWPFRWVPGRVLSLSGAVSDWLPISSRRADVLGDRGYLNNIW